MVTVSRTGGVYIEIGGNYDRFKKDMAEVRSIARAEGKSISNALSGALSPDVSASHASKLTESLNKASRSAKAFGSDLSSFESAFRKMGTAIGISGASLETFVSLQKKSFQTKAADDFNAAMRNIERQTGASAAQMAKLRESLGGAALRAPQPLSEFAESITKARSAAKSFNSDLSSLNESYRKMGLAIGIPANSLEKFASLQRQAFKVKAADDFNAAMRNIERQTGASAAQMAKLRESLGGLNIAAAASPLPKVLRESKKESDLLANSIRGAIALAAGYVGIGSVSGVAKTSIDYQSQQKTFIALTGSESGSRTEMAYLREEAQRLGQDFNVLTDSYKGFLAAAQSSGLDTEKTRYIFESITEASTVMGLSAERTKYALLAVEQMLSKGNVSLEELRRQLGEHLAGAFSLAAKAMDVTTSELIKLISAGDVESISFLLKFANQLKEAFGGGLEAAMSSARAEVARLKNEMDFRKIDIGAGGLLDGVTKASRALADAFGSPEARKGAVALGSALGSVVEALGALSSVAIKNAETIATAAVAIGTYYGTVKLMPSALKAWSVASDLVSGGLDFKMRVIKRYIQKTGLLTAAFRALGGAGGMVGLALGAAAAGFFALATQESEAVKYARDHASAMELSARNATDAAKAAEDYAKKLEGLTAAEKGYGLAKAKDQLKGLQNDSATLYDLLYTRKEERFARNVAIKSSDAFGLKYDPRVSHDGDSAVEGYYEQINKIKNLSKATSGELLAFRDTILLVAGSGGPVNIKAVEDLLLLIETAASAKAEIERFHIANLAAGKGLLAAAFAATRFKKEMAGANQEMANVANIDVSKILSTAEKLQANLFLMRLSSDEARARAGALLSSGFKPGDLSAETGGLRDGLNLSGEASAGALQVDNLATSEYREKRAIEESKRAGQEEQRRQEEASRALASAASEARSFEQSRRQAASQLEDDIARLTMSEREYAALKRDTRAEELQGLGVSAERIQAWKEATEKTSLKKIYDESTKALQDFENEYQRAFSSSGGMEKSIAADMDKFRVAAEQAFSSGVLNAEEYASVLERINGLQKKELEDNPGPRDWLGGANRSIKEYLENVENLANETGKLVSSTFGHMEDALSNFVLTGKLKFSDLVSSIAADLARLAVRQMIMAPLAGALGGLGSLAFNANGGVYESPSLSGYSNSIVSSPTLFAFAKGGVPNLGVMGERGKEGILPLVENSSGKLGVSAVLPSQGSDGITVSMGDTNITVNVVTNSGSSDEEVGETVAASIANELNRSLTTKIKEVLLNERRQGGMLSKV